MGRIGIMLVAALAVVATSRQACAQSYPERPVEVVVAFSPGAVTDVLGRALAESLSAQLGQRFIVVNKTGATGALGSAAVARARPDGYSLLFAPAVSLTVVPLSNKQAGYDHKSFEPICQAFVNEMVVVVRPDSPLKTAGDLVAAAKAKPAVVNYAHLGTGSIPHLAMVEFAQVANVEFNAIPFKGDADVMQQVLGGQVDFGAVTLSSAAGGGLRILGLFGNTRNPSIPDVPTMREQGFAIAPYSFGGLLAPTGLPPEVKRRLADGCRAAARSDAYARLAKSLFQPTDYYADGTAFAQALEKDLAEKARLLKTLGGLN
jgi:tripartite-type tricarboxylate transporter receptor subunit TctC